MSQKAIVIKTSEGAKEPNAPQGDRKSHQTTLPVEEPTNTSHHYSDHFFMGLLKRFVHNSAVLLLS